MTQIEKEKIKLWLKSLQEEKIDLMDFVTLITELIKH